LKTGAFTDSDMASAMRLVFPVLEKYNTQVFMICYFNLSRYIIFVSSDLKTDKSS
jgi:hypothetical protein